jgi:pyruvate, water dikinase
MIKNLLELDLSMVPLVGGKNASLGEMMQNMTKQGIRVPDGFVLTVNAYDEYIRFNNLEERINEKLKDLDVTNLVQLRKLGMQIRQIIADGEFPESLKNEIQSHYKTLSKKFDNEMTDVAVRSSATAEDLPDASFAGQQESFLNVRGNFNLMNAIKSCFASLFTDRAISYRSSRGFDHYTVKLSVCIQKMVRSDIGASGVAFSIDTESGFKDIVLINGAYGLGELIVQGVISPDEFIVFKPTLAKGKRAIIEKKLGRKTKKLVYGHKVGEMTREVPVGDEQINDYCLDDDQILELAKWVVQIEDYYSKLRGVWTPMDVEWAFDGLRNELFIVQARPETIHSQRDQVLEYKIKDKNRKEKLLFKGIAVGDGIGAGKVRALFSLDGRGGSKDESDFRDGEVLVTEMTDPDWEPLMKKASAIITNKGGRTCHAAIVARELGIPAIVGTQIATQRLEDGQEVTASCSEGNDGRVYEGLINFEVKETAFEDLPKVKTPIMMNVASPEMAFNFSRIPNAGVGLAREEFIINNFIQVHPLALLHHKELDDSELTNSINELIKGFDDEEDYFIRKLSYGVAKIGAAFYPKDVIVRFSDFKSNEYRNLLGGQHFEPIEENPMIGWRGASRYYSEQYRKAFGLECKAIKKVRDEYGLTNVIVMIPFCRTPKELRNVYEVMESYGLKRGENGLKVFLMAELPSNIILAEEFSKHIDGFSIGSNDLTQLTLGLDRDSSLVAHIYDERNEAVKEMIRKLIKTAKATHTKVGICGQGPSDFPDFAAFLVGEGIDTISVTPDSVLKTLKTLHQLESEV